MSPSRLQALADDLSGSSLGLRLPAGTIVDADDGRPVMWLSDEPADQDLLDHLWSDAPGTGLWPTSFNRDIVYLQPPEQPDPTLDAEAVLAGWASRYRALEPDHDPAGNEISEYFIHYWRNLPGSCLKEPDADRLASRVAYHCRGESPFAVLVPGIRSSDVFCTLGWTGPVNYGDPVQSYSAVMRAWEDQFGARVAGLTTDSLTCSVARPPTTPEQALALAHRQLAFCPDLAGEFDSVNTHAASLIGRTMWSFWWD